MCSNRGSDESLECYMDDIVACFEDFVRKSLIAISVGVAAVVVMVAYLLKVINNERRLPNQITEVTENPPRHHFTTGVATVDPPVINNAETSSSYFENVNHKRKQNTSTNRESKKVVPNRASMSSFEEKVLRNSGLSSYNQNNYDILPKDSIRSTLQRYKSIEDQSHAPNSRISIPSLQTAIPKRKSDYSMQNNLPKYRGSTMKTPSKTLTNKSSCCSTCCNDERKQSKHFM